jgi:hypothetical protein
MNSEKTKKKSVNEKRSLPSWDDVRKKPILMFQTPKGPMMGHFDRAANSAGSKLDAVRLYAPAMVTFVPPSSVVFLPVAFVEHHLDLYLTAIIGTNPPPDIITQGYTGYFESFIKGGYVMQPMIMRAKIDGEEHSVEMSQAATPSEPVPEPDDEAVVTCPGCQATVADWQDHYPVQVTTPVPNWSQTWTCEIRQPGLREQYPGYEPPHPTSVES